MPPHLSQRLRRHLGWHGQLPTRGAGLPGPAVGGRRLQADGRRNAGSDPAPTRAGGRAVSPPRQGCSTALWLADGKRGDCFEGSAQHRSRCGGCLARTGPKTAPKRTTPAHRSFYLLWNPALPSSTNTPVHFGPQMSRRLWTTDNQGTLCEWRGRAEASRGCGGCRFGSGGAGGGEACAGSPHHAHHPSPPCPARNPPPPPKHPFPSTARAGQSTTP